MEELFTKNNLAVVSSDRVLYTASPFARTSLLHLQEIGSLRALQPHTSSRSDLRSFLFFVVVDGSGELIYDGKKYDLHNGDCVFIDCNKPYSHSTGYNGHDRLWSLKWIHLYGPTMPSVYSKYCERGGRPVFKPEYTSPFFSVIDNVFSVARSSDYMRDMKINQYLSELMVYIMTESWHPEEAVSSTKRASILPVKEYLDRHYADKISLDDLCEKFFISKYYLSHSFKMQFGISVINYLMSVRITQAKQLLRFTDKSVEKIGEECGIGALHYFSRVFKETEGVSPSAYREMWQSTKSKIV